MYWSWQLCNINFTNMSPIIDLKTEFEADMPNLKLRTTNDDPTLYLSHYIDLKLDRLRYGPSALRNLHVDFKSLSSDSIPGVYRGINNQLEATPRIPFYDIEYMLNIDNEPGLSISMIGNIPSKSGEYSDSSAIDVACFPLFNSINHRINPSMYKPLDSIYHITLSYVLVSIYLTMKGNVVTYVIDPSCKESCGSKDTVLKCIHSESDIKTRHSIIEKTHTHLGHHVLDNNANTKDDLIINLSQENAIAKNRQQHIGVGKKKSHKKIKRIIVNHKKTIKKNRSKSRSSRSKSKSVKRLKKNN